MTNFLETKELWAAVIGALIGAAATISAVWIAVGLGLRKLRDTQMSRLRIKSVTELIAHRLTLSPRAAAGIDGPDRSLPDQGGTIRPNATSRSL